MMLSRTIRRLLALLTYSNIANVTNNSAPISRLPAEILSVIFEFSSPQILKRRFDSKGSSGSCLQPLEDELPVLYVNRDWRNIAISVLALSPIPIFLDISTPSTDSIIIRNHVNSVIAARLERYLVQTAPAPLLFRVYHTNTSDFISGSVDEAAVEILRSLCRHCDRWVDVHLHLRTSTWHSIWNDIRSPLRRLRSLELGDTDVRGYHAITHGGQAFMPSFMSVGNELFSLTLGCSILFNAEALRIPWSRLTTINLKFVNPPNFHFILEHCVNLRECYLDDYDRTSVRWTPPAAPIAHSALRTLRLKNCDLSHFLPLVHAPNVGELHVDCSVFAAVDVAQLSSLPCLRELHLRFGSFHVDLIAPLLGKSSGVEELYLDFRTEVPISALDSLARTSEIVPGLRHLHLKFEKVGAEDALVKMIERRMMSVVGEPRLLSLMMEGGSLSGQTLRRLRALAAVGLAIEGLDLVTQLDRRRALVFGR